MEQRDVITQVRRQSIQLFGEENSALQGHELDVLWNSRAKDRFNPLEKNSYVK